ncbi:MAG: ATP-dependent DNA helicase RecG [Ruminococcaceae bacterium]|nr:ATP-dependent DNA helicase RecG [Oscillospiraceae bacterium]
MSKAWDEQSVSTLYGVGKARETAYARLGVRTVGELLEHYPRSYENRGDVKLLETAPADAKCAVVLTVATQPRVSMIRRGMSLLKFRAYDDSGSCEITFFNQNYHKDSFPLGATFRFYGKVERVGKRFAMSSPAFEEIAPDGDASDLAPLFPVYPLTEGLSQKQIATNIAMALRLAHPVMEDPLPAEWRVKRALCTLPYAMRQIHAPESMEALAIAKKRLIYDEFLMFALGLAASRSRVKQQSAPQCDRGDLAPLTALLPYELTGAQKRAIDEIKEDMAKNVPMSRMVVGDVGCGKTICAAAAMLFAVQSGYQAALMAPTEILARQHASELSELFSKLGIRCALLIGATTAAQKKKIKSALSDPDPATRLDVVIGTQALLSDGVEFSAPGLVVTDEQHRFGVGQRATLSERSHFTHLLVMSATPIPRSLALGLYGDLDISRIDEMPPGRQVVETVVVDDSYRARLDGFIDKQVSEGGQVYVVCPAIEQDEEIEAGELALRDVAFDGLSPLNDHAEGIPLKSAVKYAEELAERLPHIGVACLHGKMKPAEKDAIMQRFVSGEVQVLVSTTVIEVGVNVPSATLMIIENAERFGLSQLHQLRGRVGRGKRKSYCVLVKGAPRCGEVAEKRLATMKHQHDGFEIARQDLMQRGPGDFLRGNAESSIRQSGGIRFRLADQCEDGDFMQAAFDDARELLETDAQLVDYPLLRARMERMFSVDIGVLN